MTLKKNVLFYLGRRSTYTVIYKFSELKVGALILYE